MRKIDYLTSLEEKEEECMTLEEAIIHCKEKACSNTQCAREHRQLAEWLQELQQYRTKMKELQQDQPEVDLEKEYKEYVEDDPVFSKLTNSYVGLAIARHFWNKGYNARKEE